MKAQQEYIASPKEQQILDIARERAIKNKENYEAIKRGIIRETALSLLNDAKTPKPEIARLLIKNLANKEAEISQYLIYDVLRAPEFKQAKDQSHMNRRLGKGGKSNVTSFDLKTSNILYPNGMEIVAQEIKKIRQENPDLTNKQIREKLLTSESINKELKQSTLKRILPELIPIYKQSKEEVSETTKVSSSGIPKYALNRVEIGEEMLKRIKQYSPILEWLSGMDEPARTTFYKHLPKGKSESLALEEQCRDHIRNIVKIMLDRNLDTFLKYSDELTHLNRVFDEELYNEKQLREKRLDMASR